MTSFDKPIKWAHFPADAKALLRSARIRPKEHQCFVNASQTVMRSSVPGLRYAEGWVRQRGSDQVFAHAWVVMNGKDIDVTLPELPQIFTRRTFSARRVAQVFLRRGTWGFITPELVPSRTIYPPVGWWPRTKLEREGAYE